MSQPTLAFLGLGVMGGPMAGWLVKNGHQVRVWNRTHAKAEAWAQSNPGEVAETIAQAVAGADFVMACVGDDPDARAVALAAFAAMKPGAVYVHHDLCGPIEGIGVGCFHGRAKLAGCSGFRWSGWRGQWPTNRDVRCQRSGF